MSAYYKNVNQNSKLQNKVKKKTLKIPHPKITVINIYDTSF